MTNIRPLKPELALKAKEILQENEARIKMALLKIKQWLELQPHLKFRMDNQWLIAFIRGCRYSLEKTKETIDAFCTLRTLYANVYGYNKDPKKYPVKHFLESGDALAYNDVRDPAGPVYYLMRSRYDPTLYSYDDAEKYGSMMIDMLLYENDNISISGIVGIFELDGTSLTHTLNVTASAVKKVLHMLDKGYPMQVKALHFVNSPVAFKVVFDVFKMFAPQHLQQKFFVHTTMEELYEHIPQDQLPKDYGGKAPSIADLMEHWKAKFESYRDWFIEDEQYCSNESLRPPNSFATASQCSVI